MCIFFRKKKKAEPINSKFSYGELVRFRYRDELSIGYVYKIRKDENGNIIYAIQTGGECPAIIENIEESKILLNK